MEKVQKDYQILYTHSIPKHHARFKALVKPLVHGHLGKNFPNLGNRRSDWGYKFLFISPV
jgi:hypothetical protein